MPAAPRVSIGVPVYNGEKYLPEALDSVCGQDFDSLEIVISDNASTDGTEEMCRAWAARDSRIRYVRQERNRGGFWNANHLIDLARGREFKWANSDDACAPNFVAECTKALDDAGPAAVSAHSRVLTIDKDSKVIEERNDAALNLDVTTPHERVYWLLKKLAYQAEFGLIRMEALRRTHRIQPYIGSEMFLLTELCLQGRLVGVPGQLVMLRRHDEQFGRDRFTEGNWYIGSGRQQSLLPFVKINTLLMRTVLLSELSPGERAKCARSVLAGWTIPRWRAVASDIRHLPEAVQRRREINGERPT